MLNRLDAIEQEAVEHTVQAILQSSVFRSSRQCQLLLRYIVDHSLAGEENLLRERVIGAQVFGRPVDYDTGNDPVVRSRVAEVRKRLAQCYDDQHNDIAVHITIPSGSYRAVFSQARSTSTQESSTDLLIEQPASSTNTGNKPLPGGFVRPAVSIGILPALRAKADVLGSRVILVRLLALCIVGAAAALLTLHQSRVRQTDKAFLQFWIPFRSPAKTAILYIGANYTYRLTGEFLNRYRQEHGLVNTGPEFFISLQPNETIARNDLIPTNNFIGFGDVAATGKLIAMLTRLNERYDLRYGDDITVTDLQSSPVLLIGGFSNTWTLKLTEGLRYTLAQGDRIVDHQDSSKIFRIGTPLQQNDYAIVSRMARPDVGSFVVAIAGVGSGANQAAAAFICDPRLLDQVLQKAPIGWENMNMQMVLRTRLVNGIPVATDVQAISFS